ncbi:MULTISPECIES: IS66 family insertion sequence element accessory protein TnpB, partial [unclassified Roseovarius]|uniref:IS66 family insertion sequence element accessory protein TnpB n=1 Tax=unclassified Roseovarius TaxID=2614913 RepID=UPI0018FE551A
GLGRDPHAGEIFCFRGRKGDLVKLLWHDGVGMSLYVKRLEAGSNRAIGTACLTLASCSKTRV